MDNKLPPDHSLKAYILKKRQDKLDAFDKITLKEQAALDPHSDEFAAHKEKTLTKRQELSEKYSLKNWITEAAAKAGQISLVTHAPKFTHSDAKSSGVLVQPTEPNGYLTTSSLPRIKPDIIGNAAAMDVAVFLEQPVGDHTLLDEIIAGNSPALKELDESDDL